MFKRVLIANRGEIAIRIARAAAALGVESVAVFTPADALSLHTELREARRVEIGRRRRCAAYLDVEAVIAAAKASGCDCVHPGYGFLAENAALRRALRGRRDSRSSARRPRALDAVRRQGRRPAPSPESLGVPVVPGSAERSPRATTPRRRRASHRLPGDAEGVGRRRRARHARRDRARGDGRGVRALPQRGRRRRSATARCSSRSSSPRPRHIEVQILADAPRQRRAPLRARLLGAAAQPEGRRGRAGARPRRRPARSASSPTPSRSRARPAT